MSSYVRPHLRRLVAHRAHHVCEYCLIHEDDAFFGCEIEHIISEKHGGKTVASNLAWACAVCNRFKGSDIATILPGTRKLIRLFDPRSDEWSEHFRLRGSRIVGVSDMGKATVSLLDINSPERIMERQTLIAVDRFPSAAARAIISGGNA
jgi:HNH endonuclease